jgi:hypothetical protein
MGDNHQGQPMTIAMNSINGGYNKKKKDDNDKHI